MVHGFLFSFSILFLSVILLFVVIKIMQTISPRLQITNILVLFMLFYFVFAYIGSVVLNVWDTEPGMRYFVDTRKDILLKVWLITSFGLLVIPLYTSIIFKSVKYHPPVLQVVKQRHLGVFERFILYGIFFICCIVFLLYVNKIGGIPLLRYIANPSLSQSLLRSDATNNFVGKAWRYVLFYESIPVALFILVSFSDARKFRNILFIYCAFICIMNFEKAPIVKLLILIVLIYMRKKGRVDFKYLVLLGILGLMLLVLMYIFFMNASGGFLKIVQGILGRTFLTQIIPFFWYFRYAESIGFLQGTSFPNPAGIFPFEHTRITVEVMNLYREEAGMESDVVGSMPTVFMADWYVNFGYLGVILSVLFFTVILVCLIIIFNKKLSRQNDVYTNAAFIIIIEHFAWYSGTSFTGILFDMDLIIPLCLLFVLKCLRNSHFLFKINIPSRSQL